MTRVNLNPFWVPADIAALAHTNGVPVIKERSAIFDWLRRERNEKRERRFQLVSNLDEEREKTAAGSVIYFVEAPSVGLIKIGHTGGDLADRVSGLRSQSPVQVCLLGFLPGALRREQYLHHRFSHIRAHGEWFRDCPALRHYIATRARLPENYVAPVRRGVFAESERLDAEDLAWQAVCA